MQTQLTSSQPPPESPPMSCWGSFISGCPQLTKRYPLKLADPHLIASYLCMHWIIESEPLQMACKHIQKAIPALRDGEKVLTFELLVLPWGKQIGGFQPPGRPGSREGTQFKKFPLNAGAPICKANINRSEGRNSNTIIVGDYNTPLSTMDRLSSQ